MFELGTDGPRTILAGIDGSETSMRAGAYAAGLARRQGSHLILVFVHVTTAAFTAEGIVAAREAQASTIAELRAQIAEHSGRLGLSPTLYERKVTRMSRSPGSRTSYASMPSSSARPRARATGSSDRLPPTWCAMPGGR